MENNFLTIKDENGKDKLIDVISYFTRNSDGQKFIIYTDADPVEDEDGNVDIYQSKVIENEDGSVTFEAFTDEEDIAFVNYVMEDLIAEGENL